MSYTTLWELPDDLWRKIEWLLPPEKPVGSVGRPALPNRQVVNGILFVLRSGCQWNQLPTSFPDDSSVHRTFVRWSDRKVFEAIWADLIEACEDLDGVEWEWQAADGSMVKARKGGR